jgi:hypothetical protein
MDDDDQILLTHLSRELQAAGYEPVDYGRSYRGALSARYPCEQDPNGRWIIRRRNLSKVASALRLKKTDPRAFEGETTQVEAIPPDALVEIITDAITDRIDQAAYDAVLADENSAKAQFRRSLIPARSGRETCGA